MSVLNGFLVLLPGSMVTSDRRSQVFECNAPDSGSEKFMCTFPYPYMCLGNAEWTINRDKTGQEKATIPETNICKRAATSFGTTNKGQG